MWSIGSAAGVLAIFTPGGSRILFDPVAGRPKPFSSPDRRERALERESGPRRL